MKGDCSMSVSSWSVLGMSRCNKSGALIRTTGSGRKAERKIKELEEKLEALCAVLGKDANTLLPLKSEEKVTKKRKKKNTE